ncbi:MAG: DegT/DnrJ/EryC1/StrS family aminotransferase [Alphaproteobacteria bacterium]|nr:DegT/DnrJ/EryC1/StrS family aminotransferase [Alphaproteobacteria bacterium]
MKYELASSSWDNKEIEAIQDVIRRDCYTMGKSVHQFEEDFARYTNHKYCVMVNSGSSANLLAIAAMFYKKDNPLKRGDEVIVPAVSWATTYYPLYQYGLHLKFVDVNLETLNMDTDALAEAITDKTRLIFAVNLLGNPNEFAAIQEIIKCKNITLLEDNCESLGGVYDGKPLGSIGLIGTYSTFFSHHMATMEGGVIGTDDEELYDILLSIRSHGWTRHLPKENKLCVKSDNNFEESWRFILPGYNVRPVEMMGAIGIEQLKKLPEFIRYRRENAEYFKKLFGNDERFILQREIGLSSWFGFSFLINKNCELKRQNIIEKLTAANIETRPIVAGNFARKEVVNYFDFEIAGDLKNADYIDQYGFFIGNHQFDIKDKLDYLKQTLDIL